MAFERLRLAERALADGLAPALPLLSADPARLALSLRLKDPAAAMRLLWCLGRLDRYADFGRGRDGAGLEFLTDRIELQLQAALEGRGRMPAHLGYFIPQLEETARRWKHTWAPKIKAERAARGVRRKRRLTIPEQLLAKLDQAKGSS